METDRDFGSLDVSDRFGGMGGTRHFRWRLLIVPDIAMSDVNKLARTVFFCVASFVAGMALITYQDRPLTDVAESKQFDRMNVHEKDEYLATIINDRTNHLEIK